MAEQQDTPIRPIDNSFQRRAIGAALGLTLAVALTLAFAGFWNWLFFVGVPVVRQESQTGSALASLVCLAPIGLFGLGLGLTAAWPEQRRGLVRAFLVVGGVVFVALVAFFWTQLQVVLIMLVAFTLLAAILLVFRQIVEWIQPAFRRSRRSGYLALLIILGVLIVVSVVTNGVWLQFPFSDEGILLSVHRHALAQGWQVHTLELGNRISGVPDVRVRMADGPVLNCRMTYGFDKQTVMCKP